MINGMPLMPEDVGGVLLLELLVSGYAAQERGSEEIGPKDLAKAVYIVDLEHVQKFWSDWEGFEAFVAGGSYLSRVAYLIRLHVDQDQAPAGTLRGIGRPTEAVVRAIGDARLFAS